MKLYKVFAELKDGRIFSSWSLGKAQVEYEVGKLSEAPKFLADKGYWITAFETLQQAYSYKRSLVHTRIGGELTIYEVAICGRTKEPGGVLNNGDISRGVVPDALKSSRWPNGTVMVEGVIPMRKVENSELSGIEFVRIWG